MAIVFIISETPNYFFDLQKKLHALYGFEVYTCLPKDEILNLRLKNNTIDVIIIDSEMQYNDPHILCSEIKSKKENIHPFIIMVGADTEDYAQCMAFDSGADFFLAKPIKIPLLAAQIKVLTKEKTYQTPEEPKNPDFDNIG